MDAKSLLDFLTAIAALKDVPRHCETPKGAIESVADHSWRLSAMALLVAGDFPNIDMNKVIRMCILHDIGEAVTGDIPTFVKTKADGLVEDRAIESLLAMLPEREQVELRALFREMDALETKEARLVKAMDKLEAVHSHNESRLESWIPLEYELNRTYGEKEAAEFPLLKEVRAILKETTDKKIAEGRAL